MTAVVETISRLLGRFQKSGMLAGGADPG
ncbi:hypothetical protein FK513_30640 [Klebsiella pneumoniae]|nr:hypothetical protein [Klebsiella pneumoniae]